jgi:hypothetical protein
VIHSDLQKIRIMGIRTLRIDFGERPQTGNANQYAEFRLLESDSKLSISPVRRQTDSGGMKTVAFTIDVSAFVSQNNYAEYTADLDNINRAEITGISVLLASHSEQPAASQMLITMNRADVVRSFWASTEIETVEHRPRLNVKCGGVLSANVFDQNTQGGMFLNPGLPAQELFYEVKIKPSS